MIDKDAVRDVLTRLVESREDGGRWFSPGSLGIEQATNRIMSLQRPPSNLEEVALTVHCPYCGTTPGNRCRRRVYDRDAHPSRINLALSGGDR